MRSDKMRKTLAIAGMMLALSACSSREEKLCRSYMSESLLNPETAKFSNFRPIADDEIKEDEDLAHMKQNIADLIPAEGAKYYAMKVRAEGKLGNNITDIQFCSVNAERDKCACLEAE